MNVAPLGELVAARSSLEDPKKPQNAHMPHVSPEHIEGGSGRINWSKVRSCEEDGVISGKYVFQPGDIIYSKIRPYLNKIAVADRIGMCSADMYALVVNEDLASRSYLTHWMASYQFLGYAALVSGRANIPKINRTQLLKAPIPLPPLEEQRRIAGILDAADALRRRRREALALLDTLPGAIFANEADHDDNWEVARFGDLVEIGSGNGFPIAEQGQESGEYPFLKVGDMTLPGNEERLIHSRNWIGEDARARLKAKVFPEGAIVFPKIGAAIATNKKRLLAQKSCVDNNVMVATPRGGISSRLILEVLRKKNISDFASTSNPPSIRKGTVEEWELKFPKEERRASVEKKLFSVDATGRNYRAQLDEFEALFASLQSRAFAGEL